MPAAAYDAVLLAAELGTLAVLLGIVLTARPLLAFLRAGGWKKIHRAVLRAFAATGLTGVILLAVVVWAHHVTAGQRNGGDLPYSGAFLLLVASGVASLALWTYAAVATARELDLARASLRREMFLAVVTTVMMAVMTVAATIWWTSVYGAPARMLAMTLVMVSATAARNDGWRAQRATWAVERQRRLRDALHERRQRARDRNRLEPGRAVRDRPGTGAGAR